MRGGKYHAQIRKSGYPPLTKTFSSLTIAKRWASTTEADMERSLHIVVPGKTAVRELLERYEKAVLRNRRITHAKVWEGLQSAAGKTEFF
mgnify:FL=1